MGVFQNYGKTICYGFKRFKFIYVFAHHKKLNKTSHWSQNMCRYKNIFGKPNQGIHSIRLFNLAIIDVIMALIAGYLIGLYFNHVWLGIIGFFTLGIIMHAVFCVDTTISKMLKHTQTI